MPRAAAAAPEPMRCRLVGAAPAAEAVVAVAAEEEAAVAEPSVAEDAAEVVVGLEAEYKAGSRLPHVS